MYRSHSADPVRPAMHLKKDLKTGRRETSRSHNACIRWNLVLRARSRGRTGRPDDLVTDAGSGRWARGETSTPSARRRKRGMLVIGGNPPMALRQGWGRYEERKRLFLGADAVLSFGVDGWYLKQGDDRGARPNRQQRPTPNRARGSRGKGLQVSAALGPRDLRKRYRMSRRRRSRGSVVDLLLFHGPEGKSV